MKGERESSMLEQLCASQSIPWTLLELLHVKVTEFKGTNPALKVAEHSFEETIPNSPLLLSYLSFGARFLQESRLTIEEFILAFWLRCELLPWQRG